MFQSENKTKKFFLKINLETLAQSESKGMMFQKTKRNDLVV